MASVKPFSVESIKIFSKALDDEDVEALSRKILALGEGHFVIEIMAALTLTIARIALEKKRSPVELITLIGVLMDQLVEEAHGVG